MPTPGLSLRLGETSGIGELAQENKAGLWFAILLEWRDPGRCLRQQVPQTSSLGFRSDLWYHTPTPNRIPRIPTLGCISSCFHVASWNPREEMHIGIQTPEHLAKPNPAGLRMRHWPPLEPLASGPPALSLTNALCPLTYSTQMSKHALPHHMSWLPLNGFYFSNHVLKLNHEIVGMSCACVSRQARTHRSENKSGQESSQVHTKNKLVN